jgi:hypothetical protein
MNEEQEMRAKAIELAMNWKSKVMAAALIANRDADGLNPFDGDVDLIYTYISTGKKPEKKQ